MPLNLRERINSRISLLCSVVVLVLLVLVMHQMDYTLIRKPQKEAAEAAALKEQQDKIEAETPVISTASVIAVGDNLYHSKLYESGEYDSGTWNYDHIYTHVGWRCIRRFTQDTFKHTFENRENLDITIVVDCSFSVSLEMEWVNHINIVKVCSSSFIG